MKKKYYTVFFASERNNYSRSVQVSKTSLSLLVFFGIILIGLAIVGGLRIANQDSLTQELKSLKENRVLFQNIMNDLKFSSVLDSSNSYGGFVSEFYSSQNMDYPNTVPVEGYVTRGLQIEENHLGIDIAAKYQDNIKASGYGRVVFLGKSEDLGNTIILNHPGGFVTVYGHIDTNLVVSGQTLEKGQVIAKVGETGKSQAPHLHFEIWKNNQVLDPREIIPVYKEKDVSIRQTRK